MLFIILDDWISPTVIGDRPPPIHSFTLTSINNSSAILFGGDTANGFSNNVYILNFTDTSVVSVLLVYNMCIIIHECMHVWFMIIKFYFIILELFKVI